MRDDHLSGQPTFTGARVDVVNLKTDDIDIRDICHHLSLECRYTGAPEVMYSVAQHSVLVARRVDPEIKLAALLHDAPEAYIRDLSHCVKHNPGHPLGIAYRALEQEIEGKVALRFGLEPGAFEDWRIKRADDEVFDLEWAKIIEKKGAKFDYWTSKQAESYMYNAYVSILAQASAR